ncbi:MAG: hypothetical protein JWN43_3765 [Gammaproteobacteria bacterium]|nr:hypothetical protein [Gammaproteobacteria bacterium]
MVFTREKMRDKSEFDVYSAKVGATLAGRTSKVHAAYGACVSLEGAPIEGAVIIEFPSLAEAKDWYDGPGYRDARQHRFAGADYRVFITEGR